MKRIIASILTVILLAGMLVLATGCSPSYIVTAKGEKQDIGYYKFYVHWQRDYFKALLQSNGFDLNASLDNYYSETETVRQAIVSTAKSQYLSFLMVNMVFEDLGLTLSEEDTASINKVYDEEWIKTYGEKGMKNILKELGLKKEQFIELLSVERKSNAIVEYYYGPGGSLEITEQAKKEYFEENYIRFKYVLLSKVDDDDDKLADETIEKLRTLATTIKTAVDGGEFIGKYIEEHSEDYNKITDKMTEQEKEEAEAANKTAIEDGIICDQKGIFNQTLYNYYGIAVNSEIVKKLNEMQNGETAVVEVDNAIWVIQKCDRNEKESYYNNRATSIYQTMYATDFNNKYTQWMADLDYKFNEKALEHLDPGTFSDLFSEVYKAEEDTSSK